LRDSLRPPQMDAATWEPIFANLVAQVGPTWGDFVRMLGDNAAYLGRLGLRVYDVNELFAFELLQAAGLSPVGTLAEGLDAALPAPGLTLSFGRVFTNSITGHYQEGALGRGWHHSWEDRLLREPDGTVVFQGAAGAQRRFEPNRRAVFAPEVDYYAQP